MSRFEFFQVLLSRVEEIQTALNTLRATIKQEIQNDAPMHDKACGDCFSGFAERLESSSKRGYLRKDLF